MLVKVEIDENIEEGRSLLAIIHELRKQSNFIVSIIGDNSENIDDYLETLTFKPISGLPGTKEEIIECILKTVE